MADLPIAKELAALWAELEPVFAVIADPRWADRQNDPTICDFLVGNPHDMPHPGIAEAIKTHAEPKHREWFAYTHNDPDARAAVAQMLRDEGIGVTDEDVTLTSGAFGALSAAIRAITDPGDEIVYVSPPWFFYASMIRMSGGNAVPVKAQEPSFDLPVEAIAAAITPRTKAVLINTPHNPTGRIYPPSDLQRLADVLGKASDEHGHPIVLISDESYRRIVYEGASCTSPVTLYPWTLQIYTWGKTLLAPGERMGFIAISPDMPEPERMREALFYSQIVGGWQFPNSVLQHAMPDLIGLSIDIGALEKRRDRMCDALQSMGYELVVPEGTFYIIVRSPIPDERAFASSLADRDIFVLPGITFEMPGWFRISLTATDDMVERSLPGFEAALKEARG